MLVDVTDQTFDTEVIKAKVPVLIDMWAPWCGPCRMVEPVLKKLADKYQGKVKFCRLNVDENKVVPSQFSVRSIPNMLFIKNGRVVDTAIGAMPESALQNKVEELLKAG
jgi:thioredoxin 1